MTTEILSRPESIYTILSSFPILSLAFSVAVRKIIGARDSWECQEPGCDKRFQDGWMVDAAHYPEMHDHSLPDYDNPDSGRILCLEHHFLEHLAMGDVSAVNLIQNRIDQSQGGHTYKWIERHK